MSREFIPYFEIKDVNEDGTFTGIASVYGVEDLTGDIIDKGAFKKTISENPTVPILWQHDSKEGPIGEGRIKEWQGKILIDGQLDLEDPIAVKAYRKMKSKLIKGLSIGFNTIKSSWEEIEGRMVRHISELKLWEVSVVTFPALPDAQVTRVKAAEEAAKISALVATEVEKQLALRDAAVATEIKEALRATEVTPETPVPVADEGKEAAVSTEPEPAEDHSAALNLISDIRSLFPAA